MGKDMRTYLVVIDETPEAEIALRFAARRAAKTNGAVEILVIIPQQEFVAWGGVQATIEDEAREQAEAVIARALDMLGEENSAHPAVTIKTGKAITEISALIANNPAIAALVLGAAKDGAPGPLVAHFAGSGSGTLTCPVMIIPGCMSREALDRLS
jgi:nucleotide-binding universal stress UspA family protein